MADGLAVDPRTTDGLRRRRLFGLEFIDAPDLKPVLHAILNRPPSRSASVFPAVVTPNVDILVQLNRATDAIENEVFWRAQYVLPDGMPIVVASRLLGSTLAARLTGSGLFEILWPALVAQDRSVVVLSASTAIARRLGSEATAARFVTPPLFDSDDREAVDAVVGELLEAAHERSPEYVLFGLGHPKDSILAARLVERWPTELAQPLCCCLGGSFAMYAGFKRRAPQWMQQVGLEWLYRFAQEPRRLFRRYFVRDLAFFGIVARAYQAKRKAGTWETS